MYFTIKCNPSCKDGTRHVHKSIVLSRYLSDDILAIIDPVIHRNAYFGHCENVLLSMITDERPVIRELALCRILKARNSKATRTVRRFKVPQLNFEVSDYTELINRTDEVTEPPVIMTISDAQLKTSIAEKETPSLFSPRFLCHSQAVERCIKLVMEASTAVSGKRNHDGFIRNKFQS